MIDMAEEAMVFTIVFATEKLLDLRHLISLFRTRKFLILITITIQFSSGLSLSSSLSSGLVISSVSLSSSVQFSLSEDAESSS